MADNKVKFLRGTSDEYTAAEKDSNTIYFTTDDGKLYIGDKEISGSDITVSNHYTPVKSTTKSASGGTLTDITNSESGT